MGVGVVIRNSAGAFLLGVVKHALLSLDVQLAEAYEMDWAVRAAKEAGFRFLHIQGDALTVIQVFLNDRPLNSYLGSLITDVHKSPESICEWKASNVRRSGNYVAHELARHVIFVDDVISWVKDSPDFLLPR